MSAGSVLTHNIGWFHLADSLGWLLAAPPEVCFVLPGQLHGRGAALKFCTAVTHTNARGSGNVRGTNPLCCTHNPLCRLDVQLEYSSRVIRAILFGGQELQAAARPVLEAGSKADEQSLLPVLELGGEASKVGSGELVRAFWRAVCSWFEVFRAS